MSASCLENINTYEKSARSEFNVHIASEILQLIIKVINGEVINFPVEVGYFYSREEALAQQKLFRENMQKVVN